MLTVGELCVFVCWCETKSVFVTNFISCKHIQSHPHNGRQFNKKKINWENKSGPYSRGEDERKKK